MVGMNVAGKKARMGILGIVISLIGLGVSIYSSVHHLEVKKNGSTNFGCNISETISCDEIARSPYSEVMGVPLGIWGAAFFLAVMAILLLGHFLKQNEKDSLQTFGLLSIVGVIASLILGVLSVGVLGKYCIVCIAIYACCFGLLAVAATHWSAIPKPFDLKSLSNGGTTAVLVVVIVVAGFKYLLPKEPTPFHLDQAERRSTQPELPKRDIIIHKTQYSGLGEDYRKGPDSAPVKIIEFADFECPACALASTALREAHKEFGDEIQIVFRNYPLDSSCNKSMQNVIHKYACTAAKVARCAGETGKFWAYAEKVFDNQRSLSDATIKEWGNQVGLSDSEIGRCLASKDIAAKIDDDVSVANGLNLTSTPTIYINGKQYVGDLSLDALRPVIQRALKNR